jgi:hypothetical protein
VAAVAPVRPLPAGVVVRAAGESDVAAIERLVLEVVREVYGDLVPEEAPHRVGDWRGALLAESGGRIVGVVVAEDDWVEDLWVVSERRGHGEGRLRVVERNLDARRFYGAHGWTATVSYRHESWGFMMVEMKKELAP